MSLFLTSLANGLLICGVRFVSWGTCFNCAKVPRRPGSNARIPLRPLRWRRYPACAEAPSSKGWVFCGMTVISEGRFQIYRGDFHFFFLVARPERCQSFMLVDYMGQWIKYLSVGYDDDLFQTNINT